MSDPTKRYMVCPNCNKEYSFGQMHICAIVTKEVHELQERIMQLEKEAESDHKDMLAQIEKTVEFADALVSMQEKYAEQTKELECLRAAQRMSPLDYYEEVLLLRAENKNWKLLADKQFNNELSALEKNKVYEEALDQIANMSTYLKIFKEDMIDREQLQMAITIAKEARKNAL